MSDRPASPRNTIIAGLVLLLATGGTVAALAASRRRAVGDEARARLGAEAAGPLVRTATAAAAPGVRELVAQGEAVPYLSVTLYAKVSGYLRRIAVDRGDHVHAGQVIGEIESPETDQALLAAQADARYKRLDAERAKPLLEKKFISPQEADLAEAAARIAEARVAGLEEQKGFELLRAPFAGTVTARYADPGALVQNAASNQTSALPVVTIADVDRLRVRLFLDQRAAVNVRRGMPVELRLPERPDFRLVANVSRVTEELDGKTRTLLAEVDVDNRDRGLVAGSFLEAHLQMPVHARAAIPVEAVLERADGHYVAVLDDGRRVHFRKVALGDTDGKQIDVLDGLEPGTRVALNVGEKLADGAQVRTAAEAVAGARQ